MPKPRWQYDQHPTHVGLAPQFDLKLKGKFKYHKIKVDEEMIDKVRRLFNVKTDTEAIQRALQKTVEDREIEEALEKMLRVGRFRTIYR